MSNLLEVLFDKRLLQTTDFGAESRCHDNVVRTLATAYSAPVAYSERRSVPPSDRFATVAMYRVADGKWPGRSAERLGGAARIQACRQMGNLVELTDSAAGWKDIILPADRIAPLHKKLLPTFTMLTGCMAPFLAAEAENSVTTELALNAARQEHAKLDKPMPTSELGSHHDPAH